MTRLEIVLGAILLISIILNVGVFVYARAAIVRLLSVSEELGDLKQMIESFASHVQSVYELDTFYGDETLHALLNHAISFNEQLDTFEYIYSLTEEGSMITDDTEEENTQEEA
jgi:hypothetical protein